MKINGPCYNCPERHPACHDHCERYAAWKKDREEIYRNRSHDLQQYKRIGRYYNDLGYKNQLIAKKGDRKRGRNGDEL